MALYGFTIPGGIFLCFFVIIFGGSVVLIARLNLSHLKRRHPFQNSDFFMFAFVHGWVKLSTGKIIIQWIFTDINVYFIGQCFL